MNKLKYTCYFAGPIEHTTNDKEVNNPKQELYNELDHPHLGIYEPLKQEADKVGRSTKEQCDYIRGLKKAGHWDIFFKEMWSIWWGVIEENSDLIDVLRHLRMLKHVNGNRRSDFEFWGDAEAVVRSDFVVAYYPNINTVGTDWEIFLAALFRIPVYLIIPDRSKTDANSTLIFGVEKLSRGKVFYSIKDCSKFICEKYNLKK